jgi:hypothetical protein
MKGKPNVDAFLNGGDAVAVGIKPIEVITSASFVKRSKLVQLPIELLFELKQTAIRESAATGKHVTETTVIEAALRAYVYR